MNKNRAIFIDRDGVINHDYGYVYKWADFKFIKGCIEGLILLQNSGFLLFIVTNQSGIGRGYYTENDFFELSRHMLDYLEKNGVSITEIYHCPHTRYDLCFCRKPAPGLTLRAQKDHNLDLENSYMIGDNLSDVLAGRQAGVGMQILVGRKNSFANEKPATYSVAENLLEAAKQIVIKSASVL